MWDIRLVPAVLAGVSLPLLILATAATAQDSGLYGRTLDFTASSPIIGARIELLDARDRRVAGVVSDSTGTFRFERVRPGAYRLRANRLGYRDVITPSLQITADGPTEVVIRLAVDVIPLAPLEVVTRTAPMHRHTGLAAFFARSEQKKGGTFIMREEIDTRNPQRVTDLLATVAGFTVLTSAGKLVNRRSNCAPTIYLDGKRISAMRPTHARVGGGTDPGEAFESLNLVDPAELEGIEIFAGAATLPPEYSGSTGACGVIAMWRRRG